MHKFEVICKCGHVGRNYYIPIAFPVEAKSGKEAAAKARFFPRVKHHHKDAIISVREINDKEFMELTIKNMNDDYLFCSNAQDQKFIDVSHRIVKEKLEIADFNKKKEGKPYFYGKIKVRNPKRFFNNYIN